MGFDPELGARGQILVELRWMALSEFPEWDRAFLCEAELLAVEAFINTGRGVGRSDQPSGHRWEGFSIDKRSVNGIV
jgi:hypothetical protein